MALTEMEYSAALIGAGIAIAGGLIGTGMAQSGIGASGMGIIAETLWILGFVLGLILLLGIIH